MSDPFDTIGCPCGPRCEVCGSEAGPMTVKTVAVRLVGGPGVLCLTTCPRCYRSSVEPPVTVPTMRRLVAQHAAHRRMSIDEMRAALGG